MGLDFFTHTDYEEGLCVKVKAYPLLTGPVVDQWLTCFCVIVTVGLVLEWREWMEDCPVLFTAPTL